jgi:hypothetical protein
MKTSKLALYNIIAFNLIFLISVYGITDQIHKKKNQLTKNNLLFETALIQY